MGGLNPDRRPIFDWADRVATVGQMIESRWQIFTKCQTCELIMPVDLRVVALVKGADFVLWNRRAKCKRLGCSGMVRFMAMHPARNSAMEPLDAPDKPAETWAQRHGGGRR